MSIYQIVIMYSICFAGEYFFPEPDVRFRFDRPDVPYVYPGRKYDWDGSDLFAKFEKEYGSSRHLSNVFNIFVVMTIFNIVNGRVINDEFNIFKGVLSNSMFIIIFVFIGVGQVVIVEFGGDAMKITRGGLHGYHWLIAVILGLSNWVMGAVFKCMPDRWFPDFGKNKVH